MAGVVGSLLSAFLLVAPLLVHTQPDGFRASLLRKNATLDLSLAAERSRRRLSAFTGTRLARVNLDYVIELAIGTPPVTVQAEVDTGSDLNWVLCSPCNGCQTPPVRLYDRTKSESFSPLPCASQFCQALPETFRVKCTAAECGYRYAYGATKAGYHYTQGVLGTETFTFGNDAVQGVAFGCSDTIYGSDFGGYGGLVGLGRSALSLVGQLGSERFSYCLSSNLQAASPILFGSAATLTGSGITSTPLLKVDDVKYYVNLFGISVGGNRLPIPEGTFALNPQTGLGGVAFDSGSPVTMLVEPAYSLVLRAFLEQMPPTYKAVNGSQFGLDVCFLVDTSRQQQAAVPSMTMHFEGLDMNLLSQNYLQFADQRGTLLCLMIGRSETVSLVGNFMQMDFHLLYDLKNSVLSMQGADCSKV